MGKCFRQKEDATRLVDGNTIRTVDPELFCASCCCVKARIAEAPEARGRFEKVLPVKINLKLPILDLLFGEVAGAQFRIQVRVKFRTTTVFREQLESFTCELIQYAVVLPISGGQHGRAIPRGCVAMLDSKAEVHPLNFFFVKSPHAKGFLVLGQAALFEHRKHPFTRKIQHMRRGSSFLWGSSPEGYLKEYITFAKMDSGFEKILWIALKCANHRGRYAATP